MGFWKWCYDHSVWRKKYPHVKEVGYPISHHLQKVTQINLIANVTAKTIKLTEKRYKSQNIVLRCYRHFRKYSCSPSGE